MSKLLIRLSDDANIQDTDYDDLVYLEESSIQIAIDEAQLEVLLRKWAQIVLQEIQRYMNMEALDESEDAQAVPASTETSG